jgi:hypothetical protein
MLCIPTLVALPAEDPEYVRARAALEARLVRSGAACRWAYLASTPFREDDGVVTYVHVFRIDAGPQAAVTALGIPASDGWWPSGQPSLPPRSRGPRAQLRLVS